MKYISPEARKAVADGLFMKSRLQASRFGRGLQIAQVEGSVVIGPLNTAVVKSESDPSDEYICNLVTFECSCIDHQNYAYVPDTGDNLVAMACKHIVAGLLVRAQNLVDNEVYSPELIAAQKLGGDLPF